MVKKPTFWQICDQLHLGVFEIESIGKQAGVSEWALVCLVLDQPIARRDAEQISKALSDWIGMSLEITIPQV
jgi:hypothetical protein